MKKSKKPIYYVTMTDKFFSGWGMAEGKINKFILSYDDIDKATLVARYIDKARRSEMIYINVVRNKPYYNRVNYLTSWGDSEVWLNNAIEYFKGEEIN